MWAVGLSPGSLGGVSESTPVSNGKLENTRITPPAPRTRNGISTKAAGVPRPGSFRSEILQQQLLQRRVLRMRLHMAVILRAAAELHSGGAAIRLIRGNRYDRHFIVSVRQGKPVAERTVGSQFDFAPTNGNSRVPFCCAINNQFGIHLKPKTFLPFELSRRWT